MAVSAQRRRRVLVAVVAALIAAGAFVLALSYSSKPASGGTSGPGGASAPQLPAVTVVEASRSIPAGTALRTGDLTTAPVPVKYLPSGTPAPYFTSVAALTDTTTYATSEIPAGQVITSTMVTTTAAAAGNPAIPGTTWDVPKGYVAMALPYTSTSTQGEADGQGTGGYLAAGDRIDILAEVDPVPNPNNTLGTMNWAYQNVLVLAVGQPATTTAPSPGASASPSAQPSGAGGLIMVQVPQQDAAVLMYMKDAKNVFLQYVLVAKGDYPQNGAPGPQPVTGPSPTGAPQSVNSGNYTSFTGG